MPNLPTSDPALRPAQILPWNGYSAALSLTFDGGDPFHLAKVLPELEKRKLKATFNLLAGQPQQIADWKSLASLGHEIGNQGIGVLPEKDLSPGDETAQVEDSKNILQTLLGVPVFSFAYAECRIDPRVKEVVAQTHCAARGGRKSFQYLTPDMEPDWFNIPSIALDSPETVGGHPQWMESNHQLGSWMVLLINKVEGSQWGGHPLPWNALLWLLDRLAGLRQDLWVAPFGEIGAYWKAQKTLERACAKKKGTETRLKWERPRMFPKDIRLKVRIGGEGLRVFQGGQQLHPASPGVYPVNFDLEEVRWITTGS